MKKIKTKKTMANAVQPAIALLIPGKPAKKAERKKPKAKKDMAPKTERTFIFKA